MILRKAILLIALAAFTASAAFPPWFYPSGTRSRRSEGLSFLLDPPSSSSQLDVSKLLLEWTVICGFGVFGFILAGPSGRRKPRLAQATPTPQATPDSDEQTKRRIALTPEEIERLSEVVSAAVKSKVIVGRQPQASRIVEAVILDEARKHLQSVGDLAGFDSNPIVQEQIAAYNAEYVCDEERGAIGAHPPIAVPPKLLAKAQQIQNREDKVLLARMGRLRWISGGLLLLSLVIMVFVLKDVTFANINLEKLTEAIGRGLLSAGLFAWLAWSISGKRKDYSFLVFAVLCTVWSFVFAYYFHVGVAAGTLKRKATMHRFADRLDDLVRQDTNDGPISVTATGDAEIDTGLQVSIEFSNGLRKAVELMDNEIAQLGEVDALAPAMLTNKAAIESETSKRVASQVIIEKYRTNSTRLIDATRERWRALRVSDAFKRGATNAFESQVPVVRTLFDLRLHRERAAYKLLEFVLAEFEEYRVKNGAVTFGVAAKQREYDELTAQLATVAKEQEAFQIQQLQRVEAVKGEIGKFAK